MSQMTSIVNRPAKMPSVSLGDKPKILDEVIWRRDGEDNQIILISKEDLPLPIMLNPTAARIFLLCNGKNTLENIARALCKEFGLEDFDAVLKDAKGQIEYFVDKEIIRV